MIVIDRDICVLCGLCTAVCPPDAMELTPTELLSAVSELLRALRLGPMELALWYRRRPDRDIYQDN